MRRTKINTGFFLSLLINMLLNLEGTIPAIIFLVLHFAFDWPLFPVFIALGLWICGIALYMHIIGWASEGASAIEPKRENKNPYSAKTEDFINDRNNK